MKGGKLMSIPPCNFIVSICIKLIKENKASQDETTVKF